MAGVKQTDRDLLDVGTAFSASGRQIATTIVLPSALPMIFSGLRIALGASLIGVVVVEMVVLITGLGGLIVLYANSFQTAELFVPILVIMVLSIALTKIAAAVQRRLTPWARVGVEELERVVD
jgi:NitT/TauT family transport system permease protein